MKKIILIIFIFTISCNKDIVEINRQFPLLNPIKPDTNAGTWKTILPLNVSDFTPANPPAMQDAAFKTQLDQIVALQKNINKEEQENMDYWGTGAVLRWNEVMRELVAKYNLPPIENADGTYPIPNAANPLAYPYFPFANPPYAARSYAYVSAAQYDALVVATHWKDRINRPLAFEIDSRITRLLPNPGLKAYPSADAVVFGASAAMLKLLFPGEIAHIDQLVASHRKARLMSGIETTADLDAGEALGAKVAQAYIQRARTDYAGAAVAITNGINLWKVFEENCIAVNEIPWISQESPKRPPMLPFFGRVKPFLFDSATLVSSIRPPAPPSTRSEAFRKELAEVKYYSENQTRERARIVHFWADGVGTYTPPGHWNAIAAETFVTMNWSEVRWARAFALLNMSMMDAAIACWDAKFHFYNPRPSQMDPSIKTATGLPNFPSYISGHSTFSGAAAEVLEYLVPAEANRFSDMANEASMSRLYGAIHYRSDCTVGLSVGRKVGGYAVRRGMADGAGR